MSDLDLIARRVEQLEALMRRLYDDVAALRAEVARGVDRTSVAAVPPASGAASSGTVGPATGLAAPMGQGTVDPVPAAPDVGPDPRPRPVGTAGGSTIPGLSDLESLVGRYGTLALATATILLGIGAFVSWAIERRLLGPYVRIGLGVIAAAAVAVGGQWLRARGTRRFGNVLLALSLAIVHVDAWGAGPELHVLSPIVALAGAALASAALGWIALRERQQTLFAVGVGGALLAPFVTSTGEPHVVALLAFGLAVVTLTMLALRDRGWDLPVLLVTAGIAGYTLAGAAAAHGPPEMYAPGGFAIMCAGLAILMMAPGHRSVMAQVALASLWLSLVVLTGEGAPVDRVVGLAALGTLAAYSTVGGLADAPIRTYLGAGALPVAFLVVALWALPSRVTPPGASLAFAWGVGAAAAALVFLQDASDVSPGAPSSPGAAAAIAEATAGGAGTLAVVLALGAHHPTLAIVALSAYGAALTALAVAIDWEALLVSVGATFALATIWSWWRLAARPLYAYRPFLTPASAAAAAVIVACAVAIDVLARRGRERRLDPPPPGAVNWRYARLVPVVLLFIWVRAELAGAGSREVATFALITYYAVAGVAAVFVGRARGIAPLRHAGLAVAVYGALKAVAEAEALGVAFRVGGYLLAGAFLLAVAYWYRAKGGERVSERPTGGGP